MPTWPPGSPPAPVVGVYQALNAQTENVISRSGSSVTGWLGRVAT
ncbi:hypothetical protein [Amycolatopsis sp. YIM 10]|nr:hypothetical protein [Amycolatopsis sp. YIM 10]QFU89922.1 hypothetical protein YIM_23725 [Amycolatopsis sp. YIM 10]